jgi:hypothetical protein
MQGIQTSVADIFLSKRHRRRQLCADAVVHILKDELALAIK